jgi:hypothetical protein
MEKRIIISIKELNKSSWGLIYQYIKHFYDNSSIDNETFSKLREISTLKIADRFLDINVYSEYGIDLQLTTQLNASATSFAILYQKQNTSRDFSNIVPFYFLYREFPDKITLGISLDCFFPVKSKDIKKQIIKQNDFTFPCRTFLEIFRDTKPIHGENTVYFINEKNMDYKTGETETYRTPIATFRNPDKKNISSYILPLTIIDKDVFFSLFKEKDYSKTNYFSESISKQDELINDSRLPRKGSKGNLQFRSVFEEWFIKAYFISLDSNIEYDYFTGLINLLKSYCENIKELVENIIFHTKDKRGLLYVIYHKKENLTKEQGGTIPYFDSLKYDATDRFVEIGIMDFNEKGIVDKYNENDENKENIELIEFFDTKKIHTDKFDHLYLKYTAHLGIKTFFNSIKNHNGSFYIESNNSGKKEAIEYYRCTLPNQSKLLPFFCNGTHYEIIFPVKSKDDNYKNYQSNIVFLQKITFSDKLIEYMDKKQLTNTIIDISGIPGIDKINTISTKQEQADTINTIGTYLLNSIEISDEAIAINMENNNFNDITLLFKLLAYIQQNKQQKNTSFTYIILINLSYDLINEICEKIDLMLIKPFENFTEKPKIWSNDTALVLMGSNLRYQIICGETKELLGYINHKMNLHYPNSNAFKKYYDVHADVTGVIDRFILPYETLIATNNQTVYQQYVSTILSNPIEAKDIGCRVNHKNSRIGNKIIIKNFYEADFLFQYSFFVDRFAYLISKEIIKTDWYINKENIVLIGFNPYSELLIKTIMRLIQYFEQGKRQKSDYKVSTFIIAKDNEKDITKDNEIELSFKFEDDDEKDNITNYPNSYKYITIVPIGSTLSTNDKIIALFKKNIENSKERTKEILIDKINFLYNYCIILIRDRILEKPTDKEKIQKWIDKIDKTIITEFNNIDEKTGIKYFIEKEGIWHLPIEEIFYPESWWKEQPVNQTQNSSLNSKNLFGYPEIVMPKNDNGEEKTDEERNLFYIDTETKLTELSNYIYFGHIKNNNTCQRYYYDLEKCVTDKRETFSDWISSIRENDVKKSKDEQIFNSDTTNILISPDTNFKSDLINIINEQLFSNSAIVLFLDINKLHNNLKDSFSFLQTISDNGNQLNFHYIDHVLLTASSYKKAKSYIMSILDKYEKGKSNFKSIIVLINRLSYDRYKELENYEGVPIYSYTHMFIPPDKDPEKECSLCELQRHYEKLQTFTVLDSCLEVINKNKEKITIMPFNRYLKEKFPKEKKINYNPRYLKRMKMKHKLFFEISNIVQEFKKDNDTINTTDDIHKLKKQILQRLTKINHTKEYLNDIDFKISFLKAISSPPLTHFIKIRYYAHQKLLIELRKILKTQKPCYNDFCLLKVILKQLSMLSSNALVRKNVIIDSWKLYFGFKKQIQQELDILKGEIKDYIQRKYTLKKMLDEKKLLLNEKNKVTRNLFNSNDISKEILKLQQEIDALYKEKTQIERKQKYKNGKRKKINCFKDSKSDFKSDFQFFIKNAIFDDEAKSMWLGELLRTGKESVNFHTLEISKTYMGKDNYIFNVFNDETDKYRDEYINFLVLLFYDNTTIIRRTLENFDKELTKYSELEEQFKKIDVDRERIDEYIDEIIPRYKQIIDQYYYSSFNKYIIPTNNYPGGNPDGIDFVKKLLYVLYAKKKLEELNDTETINADSFYDNIKSLIDVFAKIMDANDAIFCINGKITENINDIHLISTFDKDKDKNIENFDERYYTYEKLDDNIKYTYPIILNYELFDKTRKDSKDNELYAEKNVLKYEHLNCLPIKNPLKNTDNNKFVAVISFLYREHFKSKDDFIIKSHEYGRLLLLLKNELNIYIEMVLKNKISNLWVEKYESERKFDKIYGNNNHVFMEVFEEMERFENINKKLLDRLCLPWFVFTNQIISYLYASIERKKPYGLNLQPGTLKTMHTLGDIFNETFSTLIDSLLKRRWNDVLKKHEINIIKNFNNETCVGINKHFIRTIIIQQLDNSLNDDKGHCEENEIKIVNIVITDSYIRIEEKQIAGEFYETKKTKINEFVTKRKNIKELNCSKYSSTTLTSLQGVVKFMNENQKNILYDCDFNFIENRFFLEITYKEKQNKHEKN